MNEIDLSLYDDPEFRAAILMLMSSMVNNENNAHNEESQVQPIVKRANTGDGVTIIGGDNGDVINLYKQAKALAGKKRRRLGSSES